MKLHNLVKRNEILKVRMKSNAKQADKRFLNFKCKICNGEFASLRSYDSHHMHPNGVAGEPSAGVSLPSSLREDASPSPAAASLPSEVRARAAETPPGSGLLRLRSCESARTNAFGPVEGCFLGTFPWLSLLSGSPNVASHAAVSSVQTAGCIMHIEMRGGRFAVTNQANQRLLSLDVQA